MDGGEDIGFEDRQSIYERICASAASFRVDVPPEELAAFAERADMGDEVGRCTFDRACTNLFFDVVDRRYEKEVPNTLILTSNTQPNNWDEFFEGDSDTLVCTLDRIFDKASVYMMRGPSFRGAECETFSVEAVPSMSKVRI